MNLEWSKARAVRWSLPLTSTLAGRTHREGLWLILERDDAIGIGELAVWPEFDGITLDMAERGVRDCLENGAPLREIPAPAQWCVVSAIPSLDVHQPDVDSAILLWRNEASTGDDPRDTRLDAQLEALTRRPPRAVKLKIGRHANEAQRIARVRSCLPTTELRVDANRRLDRDEAHALFEATRHLDVAYWEEPCAAFEDLAALAEAGMPIALDETLLRLNDGRIDGCAIDERIAAYVCKPSLLGPRPVEHVAELARTHGARLIISSTFESALGRTAIARVASLLAPHESHGLGTGAFFREDFDLEPLRTSHAHEEERPSQDVIRTWLDTLTRSTMLRHAFELHA
ncbi:MAG: hypothetical protein KDC95_12845 [Planctomycetes bacterium]|nr:hypothetical protein [Planctomycetota bacterium]